MEACNPRVGGADPPVGEGMLIEGPNAVEEVNQWLKTYYNAFMRITDKL